VNILCEPDGSACTPNTGFLAKFSSAGRLLFSTFLGTNIAVHGLAVDSSANAYVVGDNNIGGANYRGFLAHIEKFSATGARVYDLTPDTADPNCPQKDSAYAIALNATATAAYVLGFSNSGFGCVTTTPGAYQTKGNGFGAGGMWIVKLSLAASSASLAYGTYLGPSDAIVPQGIAVDGSGNAYVTGFVATQLDASNDGKFPITSGAFQASPGGGAYSGFVSKLNAGGTGLIYSTYLHSSGTDQATSIRVDSIGDVYVAGNTDSSTFPHTISFGVAPNPQMAFLTRLNASGNGLVYSALIYGGGPQFSSTVGLGTDSAGNAYATGSTSSSSFPLSIPFQSSLRGSSDAFFLNLSGSGKTLLTSSFLGGFGQEQGTSIWVDRSWNSYLTGATTSTSFPVTGNAFQSSLKGSRAVFITKIIIDADLALSMAAAPDPVLHGSNLTYSFATHNNGPDPSDGDTLTQTLPAGVSFLSYSTTNGTCTPPTVSSGGTFTCQRNGVLLKGNNWGPIKVTVRVNAAAGAILTSKASVTAKTQDVNPANNSVTLNVSVQ